MPVQEKLKVQQGLDTSKKFLDEFKAFALKGNVIDMLSVSLSAPPSSPSCPPSPGTS